MSIKGNYRQKQSPGGIIWKIFSATLLKKSITAVFLWLLRKFSLREKWPYSESFWSVFSRIWAEYGETPLISPYSVQMWKNTDQKNSEYEKFSGSVSEQLFLRALLNTWIKHKDFFRSSYPEALRTLHKKWSFPLRISSVNVTKSAVSCGFGHLYWRNP